MNQQTLETENVYAYKPVEEITVQANDSPSVYYYPVSVKKFVILSLFSFGLYQFYWCYRNWAFVKKEYSQDIIPGARAFFGFFYIISLLFRIERTGKELMVGYGIRPVLFGLLWMIATALRKAPDPYWILCFSAVLFLIPVQTLIVEINKTADPSFEADNRYTASSVVTIVIGSLLMLLIVAAKIFDLAV